MVFDDMEVGDLIEFRSRYDGAIQRFIILTLEPFLHNDDRPEYPVVASVISMQTDELKTVWLYRDDDISIISRFCDAE